MSDDSGTFKRIAIALEGILAILETPTSNVYNITQNDGANRPFPSGGILACSCGNPDCDIDQR